MTTDPLEAAVKRVLNDRRIFWMPQELISKAEWARLRELWRSDRQTALQIVETAKGNLAKMNFQKREYRNEAEKLLDGLRTKIQQGSQLAKGVLEQLNEFGPLKCNLSKNELEDFGKVIEGHSRPTAEQFFAYKIQKEKDQRHRQALTALFEVVKELYDRHVEPLEIAFFVRKIDSFTQVVEVLK
ncbi:MAG: hypothetical protein QXS96_07590 [Candidatus Caldarchaeum sp.]